ncbi:sensor domain CHASE2-containing protein [Halopseudomonas litoralis]|uniref:Sensor domain CHASE2-containing protein n=1 Tax=Halopseudomonas litoralis TaxID=797277 RepID=A0A1H1TGS9_9GAMM|nr:CHASE2 domain-containing protein [Halopseudomonas litoralis]SDS58749.1 sensor domain CHASE2-containing protein [Halopseudomonas litoralis]
MRKDSAGTSGLFKYLFYTVLLAAVMWFFLAFSPLGISERLDKYTQDLFNSRAGSWIYPTDRQQDVAVLLLTDEVVDAVLQGQWPAPYSFHASILDDLLVHQPRAVFIDFYWMNQNKPGGDYLVNVLESYRETQVPVYLSVPDEGWLEARWPELVGLVTPVSASVVMDPTDFIARSYPQEFRGMRSAAFAIAEDQFGISAAHRGALDIFWGTADNPLNQAWMQSEDEAQGSILGGLLQGFEGVETPIPYATTVFVRDLLNPVAETEDEALRELDEHLKDRVIIYGASLSGIQDMVFTPTRSILPGVYYHAMAIDNLLTWGSNFKASVPSRTLPILGSHTLLIFQAFVLLSISALVCYWKLNAPGEVASAGTPLADNSREHHPAERWFAGAIKTSVLIIVIVACVIQFFVLDLPVATWAGFLEIIGIGVVIERLNLIERLCRWPTLIHSCFCKLYKGEQDAQDDPQNVPTDRVSGAVRER